MTDMLHELDACQKVIIENAIDGIITIDANGIIQTVNSAVSELFGYSKEELIGQNVSLIMPFPHKGKHDSYINNYLSSGEAKIIGIGREVKGLRKDGKLIPIRLAVSQVKFENKIFFTGILHDLSDIKQAEKKIIQLNEELEKKVQSRTEELNDAINKLLEFNHELKKQIHERELIAMALTESEEELKRALSKEQELNELKSKFISLASHEFRTPLSSILSSANLLKRYITPENKERKDRHLDRIKRSVENLNGILEDILSLSKLEEGMINTQFADFNLEDFFEDLLDEMSAIMKPGQEFKTDFLAACMIIHSDVRILHNICVNLLSNAIKYSKQDSKITIDLKCDSNYLNISIIDEGVGIPLNEQKHLFTRFYRGSNVTNIKGTGLGLNIVEKYVELLNGTISFESVPGKGSTFKIILPKQVGKKREVASN